MSKNKFEGNFSFFKSASALPKLERVLETLVIEDPVKVEFKYNVNSTITPEEIRENWSSIIEDLVAERNEVLEDEGDALPLEAGVAAYSWVIQDCLNKDSFDSLYDYLEEAGEEWFGFSK